MEQGKSTDWYWKIFGGMVIVFGAGYMLSKWQQGKANRNIMNTIAAKAEIEKISSQASPSVAAPQDPNITPIVQDDKVITGAMRTDGFTNKAEDVAQPTIIQVVKKEQPAQQPPMHDTGMVVPANALLGSQKNAAGFVKGDTIYAKGNKQGQLARIEGGNYFVMDKEGSKLGTFHTEHGQKMGVITKKEDSGVYFKIAPDYKRYGFIEYDKMYKLA